ncbi:MAG: hypothetical protein WDM71_04730 [Ferruginibacter sp.]
MLTEQQQIKTKSTLLERFGLYYLNRFDKKYLTHNVFDITDEELTKRVKKITRKGIILSSTIGVLCVFPTVWVCVIFANANWITYWSWFAAVTIFFVVTELYILFIIALKAVFEVSELINMHATQKDFLKNGIFSVQHILARTALQLPDPPLEILGIDPFEKISKTNLVVLGLLYKLKITLTNFVLKYGLKFTVGETLFGAPILYEALPVEAFWNSEVIKQVVREARLRLFGFALANYIADELLHEKVLKQLSPEAKIGCMRAVGNAVVMAQNYHPNMVVLLLHFQELLKIEDAQKYDDWNLFLETLNKVDEKEKQFLRNLFTIAVAFDGKISKLENESLQSAYGNVYTFFYPRVTQLTHHLKHGELNAAAELCKTGFIKE